MAERVGIRTHGTFCRTHAFQACAASANEKWKSCYPSEPPLADPSASPTPGIRWAGSRQRRELAWDNLNQLDFGELAVTADCGLDPLDDVVLLSKIRFRP